MVEGGVWGGEGGRMKEIGKEKKKGKEKEN